MRSPTRCRHIDFPLLGAATRAAAFHAAVAGAVAGHDGSAGAAGGGVTHVVHLLHGRGGVDEAAVRWERSRSLGGATG